MFHILSESANKKHRGFLFLLETLKQGAYQPL